MQDLERPKTDPEGLRGARIGHVSIAAVEGVCAAILPEVIGRLRATAPLAIPEAVTRGEADVGVAFAFAEGQRYLTKTDSETAPRLTISGQRTFSLGQPRLRRLSTHSNHVCRGGLSGAVRGPGEAGSRARGTAANCVP